MLANTEELHETITQLSSRVRELEAALGSFQSNHPALQSKLVLASPPPTQRNSPAQSSVPVSQSDEPRIEDDHDLDASGILCFEHSHLSAQVMRVWL